MRDLEAGRIIRPRPDTLQLLGDALELSGADRDRLRGRPRPAGAASRSDRRPVPAQLPVDVGGFTGRRAELERLDALLAGAPPRPRVCTLYGPAGVGKTSVAVHWAYRVRHRFPDGQLYVNLHGFGPERAVVEPARAVTAVLTALGVPPAEQPADPDAAAALYRSLLAETRTLVLLDNARDATHVRPLLPGSPGCLAVVTSRRRLTGLVVREGAQPISVGLLDAEAARQLLAQRVGAARMAAEPAAADALVAACAGLPLALAIVAGAAATAPHRPLAELVEELAAHPGGLDRFTAGEAGIELRTQLSWSYRTLTPPAARLFRLLARRPEPEFDAPAVARLTGVPVARARQVLDELADVHLLTDRTAGRYSLHPLLRGYATALPEG